MKTVQVDMWRFEHFNRRAHFKEWIWSPLSPSDSPSCSGERWQCGCEQRLAACSSPMSQSPGMEGCGCLSKRLRECIVTDHLAALFLRAANGILLLTCETCAYDFSLHPFSSLLSRLRRFILLIFFFIPVSHSSLWFSLSHTCYLSVLLSKRLYVCLVCDE